MTPNQIIISDDGSEADTFAVIKYWSSQLNINHVWHENNGFRKCKILNKSIHETSNSYIIFLDGDCLPHKHFVQDHIKLAEQGYFVQGRRCFVPEKEVDSLINGEKTLKSLFIRFKISGYTKGIRLPFPLVIINQKQRGLIGCNWSVWLEDLHRINGFDEDFEGWGLEDSEICTRLYNINIKRKFVYGHAVVHHLNHPILKRDLKKAREILKDTINTRKTRCLNGLSKTSN